MFSFALLRREIIEMNKPLTSFIIYSLVYLLTPTLIVVANDHETQTLSKEDQLRAKVVDYIRAAGSIQWTPMQDIPYYNPEHKFSFKKGETYYGIPYTQFSRNNTLDSFSSQLKIIDGVQYYVGPSEFNTYWGADCSATVSNSWKQADPNFPSLLTRRMIPDRPKPIVPVGEYALNYFDSTPKIVKENGIEVMKQAYAKLKPGDAVVLHYDYDGHAMLVLKNEPEKERLFIGDQTGLANGVPKGRNGYSTIRLDKEYTYEELFNSSYIPVALKVIDDATHEKELFNGKNLDGWSVFIRGEGSPINQNVFTVQDDILRISGEKFGGIMTNESYSNYRLTVEFKWGEKTWGDKKNHARDSGILIHSFGPQDGFAGVWAKSVEANILEGGVGDFWIVGTAQDGIKGVCDVVEKNGKFIFDPKNGSPKTLTSNSDGCFQWKGCDINRQDITGFHGLADAERPNEWNEMVIYAVDDEMQIYVNGKFVNRIYGLKQTSGKIQLQSEGAEIFFRKVTIRPWNKPLD